MKKRKKKYTCTEYREVMRLLALQKRPAQEDPMDKEKAAIREEVRRIEALLKMN